MSEDMFSCMGRSDLPWECTSCGLPNISASLFDSIIGDCSIDSSASGDVFDRSKRSSTGSCSSSEPGSLSAQSSPAKPSAKASNTGSNLRTLTINFQSLYGKKEEFWSLVDATKPDIIYSCETWLKPDMSKGEIFPPGYNLYRKDRKDGWGGVLLGVHSSLISQQLQIESEAEFVGAKIISGKQTIIIGALYRPPSSKQPYMNVLNQVIEEICVSNPGVAVWIAGDANLPDIDWATDRVVGHQYLLELNESFLQMLARTGMEQLVDFPTRNESILDIIITNRPSLINRCEGLPALGDHDIVYADWNAQASRVKPSRRKIFLWNHADFDLIRQETKEWADKFVSRNTTSTPVELLSREIEQYLQKILHDRVPSKLSSTRFNQPWFNTSTKRICRRKARAFKKARKTNRDRDWRRFGQLKKQSQITCRQAYNKYLTQ
ncbi:uncharacterized protein [Amphiura filiformis]|uniref:uncharacterized protein n=1 Tax=Amphiura filiformis TaxID=82378 RepID=UPI003B21CB1E